VPVHSFFFGKSSITNVALERPSETVEKPKNICILMFLHEGKKPFKCDIFEFICSQCGKLNHQVASIHDGRKPYEYDICDYIF
jgi:hypothetical protein